MYKIYKLKTKRIREETSMKKVLIGMAALLASVSVYALDVHGT